MNACSQLDVGHDLCYVELASMLLRVLLHGSLGAALVCCRLLQVAGGACAHRCVLRFARCLDLCNCAAGVVLPPQLHKQSALGNKFGVIVAASRTDARAQEMP